MSRITSGGGGACGRGYMIDTTPAGDVTGSGTTGRITYWTDGPNSVIGDTIATYDPGLGSITLTPAMAGTTVKIVINGVGPHLVLNAETINDETLMYMGAAGNPYWIVKRVTNANNNDFHILNQNPGAPSPSALSINYTSNFVGLNCNAIAAPVEMLTVNHDTDRCVIAARSLSVTAGHYAGFHTILTGARKSFWIRQYVGTDILKIESTDNLDIVQIANSGSVTLKAIADQLTIDTQLDSQAVKINLNSGGNNKWYLKSDTTANGFDFSLYNTTISRTALYVKSTNNNVGINTASPNIEGSADGNITLTILSSGAGKSSHIELASDSAAAAQNMGEFEWCTTGNLATYRVLAAMQCYTDASGTATKRGAYIVFKNQPDNTAGMTERMRILNSGWISIGSTGTANIKGAAALNNGLTITSTAGNYSSLELASTDSNDAAIIGAINFQVSGNTANYKQSGAIFCTQTGSTANKRGGVLQFSTSADNVQNLTGRFWILSTGWCSIGTGDANFGTFAAGRNGLTIYSSAGNYSVLELSTNDSTAGNVCGVINFPVYASAATYKNICRIQGNIYPSGTATKYGGYLTFYTQSDNTAGAALRFSILDEVILQGQVNYGLAASLGVGHETLVIQSQTTGNSTLELNTYTGGIAAPCGRLVFGAMNQTATYRAPVMLIGRLATAGTANKLGGVLDFYTQSDNTAGVTLRMTLDQTGNLYIFNTTTVKSDVQYVGFSVTKTNGNEVAILKGFGASNDQGVMELRNSNVVKVHIDSNARTYFNGGQCSFGQTGGSNQIDCVGGGYYNSGTGNWVSVSARAFKTEIKDYDIDALGVIDSLSVKMFKYIKEVKEIAARNTIAETDKDDYLKLRAEEETKTLTPENVSAAPWHIGIIADDSPDIVTTAKKDALATSDCIGLLFAAVQQLRSLIK